MPDKINGLPAHILLVHAVVVLLPLAALLLVGSAAWPAARRRIGIVGPILSLIVLVLVPITTSAGDWLRDRVDAEHRSAAIEHHVELADGLLPWAIGLFLVSAGVWLLARKYDWGWRTDDRPAADEPSAGGGIGTAVATRPTITMLPVWVTVAVVVVALVIAVGGVVDVVRIGDTGSKAVWGNIQ